MCVSSVRPPSLLSSNGDGGDREEEDPRATGANEIFEYGYGGNSLSDRHEEVDAAVEVDPPIFQFL